MDKRFGNFVSLINWAFGAGNFLFNETFHVALLSSCHASKVPHRYISIIRIYLVPLLSILYNVSDEKMFNCLIKDQFKRHIKYVPPLILREIDNSILSLQLVFKALPSLKLPLLSCLKVKFMCMVDYCFRTGYCASESHEVLI